MILGVREAREGKQRQGKAKKGKVRQGKERERRGKRKGEILLLTLRKKTTEFNNILLTGRSESKVKYFCGVPYFGIYTIHLVS